HSVVQQEGFPVHDGHGNPFLFDPRELFVVIDVGVVRDNHGVELIGRVENDAALVFAWWNSHYPAVGQQLFEFIHIADQRSNAWIDDDNRVAATLLYRLSNGKYVFDVRPRLSWSQQVHRIGTIDDSSFLFLLHSPLLTVGQWRTVESSSAFRLPVNFKRSP